MVVLSWNYRGLGNLRAVLTLKDPIRNNKPDVVFFIETLVHSNKIEELRVKLGFDFCFAVDRQGRGGGLAVLWRQQSTCSIQTYSSNFINMVVTDPIKGVLGD